VSAGDVPQDVAGEPAGAAEPATGRHRLGPHVVGRRVVVRRLLRDRSGPSGGPAFTDVLGTCLSWGSGACVVAVEGGTPLTIPLADIVSGKPVPARPSPRLRVDPAAAQRRALALWPDLLTEPLGDWLLRHSPTSTARRANSVIAMGPPGVDRPLERVVEWYAARTGRAIAVVTPGSAEERFLREAGWANESGDADTLFQVAGVAQVARSLRRPGPAAAAARERAELDERGDLVTVRLGDHASGVAAVADDWVGFRSIEVHPDRRRRGLARAVMAALVEWGAERGATTAYLQVLADNAPALALYDDLGFVTHHAYRYLADRPAPPG
jgi:ribosomal protein S18 acetylase RimI-like enzyme